MKRIIALVALIAALATGMSRPVSAGATPFQWLTFANADLQNCGSWQAGGEADWTGISNWLVMYAVTDGLNTVLAQGTLTALQGQPITGTFNPPPRQNPIHFIAVVYMNGTVSKIGDLTANDPCLPPAGPGPTPPPAPGVNVHRLQFQPNATSATVQGQLSANSIDRWIVGAAAGQTLFAQLSFAYGQGIVFVSGANGTVLQTPQQGMTTFQSRLPSTQDYYVNVLAGANSNLSYSLTITIPPLR